MLREREEGRKESCEGGKREKEKRSGIVLWIISLWKHIWFPHTWQNVIVTGVIVQGQCTGPVRLSRILNSMWSDNMSIQGGNGLIRTQKWVELWGGPGEGDPWGKPE